MFRNKSRAAAVTSKQASLMADLQNPNSSSSSSSSTSFFSSPKFRFLSSKMSPFDFDFHLISPTSILEANSSIFSPKTRKPGPTIHDPQRFNPSDTVGLAELVKGKDQSRKSVIFGSKLRVQIPTTGLRYPGHGQVSPCIQTKVLSESEREDYTRVISHGPNPTITHIFDNSVFVEALDINNLEKTMEDFLIYCYTCKKNLDQKQDIYIYKGEKGFCSKECRYHEMSLDQMEN